MIQDAQAWKLIVAYAGKDAWTVTGYPDAEDACRAREHLLRTTRKPVTWTAVVKDKSGSPPASVMSSG